MVGLFAVLPPVHTEAQALARMVGRNGPTTTLAALRELIDISPETEADLRRHAQEIKERFPDEARLVLEVIRWRKAVLAKFACLLSRRQGRRTGNKRAVLPFKATRSTRMFREIRAS